MTDKTTALENRINDLESQLAFQDDTIEQLNSAISAQQLQIHQLKDQIRLIVEKYKELQDSANNKGEAFRPEDNIPPHF